MFVAPSFYQKKIILYLKYSESCDIQGGQSCFEDCVPLGYRYNNMLEIRVNFFCYACDYVQIEFQKMIDNVPITSISNKQFQAKEKNQFGVQKMSDGISVLLFGSNERARSGSGTTQHLMACFSPFGACPAAA